MTINTLRIVLKLILLLWIVFQTGCIVISTAGSVVTTAVKSTVSIAGHTAKTAIDVVTPDGEDDDK